MTITFENLARMRRIADRSEMPGDLEWLAGVIKRYLLAADDGLTLDDAFEIATPPRSLPWWRVEALRSRDHGICELAQRYCLHSSLSRRADAVAQMLARYEATTWQSDRNLAALPAEANGTAREVMWLVLNAGGAGLSERQLTRILASK